MMTESSWRQRARCKDMPTELFFPAQGSKPTLALAACHVCQVRAECRETANENWITGVWGGTSHRERIKPNSNGKLKRNGPVK